jgi:GMP synthase (glutamine-hydrolysing)
MADEARKFYAVQFHPEVTHTIKGKEMIARFVHEICGCQHDWNMPDYVNEAIEKVRAQVGSDEVILGLSGGVDSSVVAALLHKAIGASRPACSWTTAYCASMKARWSCRCSPATWVSK